MDNSSTRTSLELRDDVMLEAENRNRNYDQKGVKALHCFGIGRWRRISRTN